MSHNYPFILSFIHDERRCALIGPAGGEEWMQRNAYVLMIIKVKDYDGIEQVFHGDFMVAF